MDVVVFLGAVLFIILTVLGIKLSLSQPPKVTGQDSDQHHPNYELGAGPYQKFESYNHYDAGEYR
jgi:hypothetical protein